MSAPPARSPCCGFGYAWDGAACSHCHFPTPSREAWAGFDRLNDQIARYHTNPHHAGQAWFSVACLQRCGPFLDWRDRATLSEIEAYVIDPSLPPGERLTFFANFQAMRRGRPTDLEADELFQHVAEALTYPVQREGRNWQRACYQWARRASGAAKFPDRPLDSFPLDPELEPHRTEALANNAYLPRPKERHATRLLRQRAYSALRSAAAHYAAERRAVERAEEAAQCVLYRDIFGYPFAPPGVGPEHRTAAVVVLADAIFADRAFDRLPVLADALEEAGCDDPHVLAHCREPGVHVRGCWVVELTRTPAARS